MSQNKTNKELVASDYISIKNNIQLNSNDLISEIKAIVEFVDKLISNFTSLSTRYENMMIKTKTLNKQMTNYLQNGIKEIDVLSSLVSRMNDNKLQNDLKSEKRAKEVKDEYECTVRLLRDEINALNLQNQKLKEKKKKKSVQLDELRKTNNSIQESARKSEFQNTQTQSRFNEMNRYINELFKSNKKLNEEAQNHSRLDDLQTKFKHVWNSNKSRICLFNSISKFDKQKIKKEIDLFESYLSTQFKSPVWNHEFHFDLNSITHSFLLIFLFIQYLNEIDA
jgi:preprotein translocase subunit SecD